MRRSYCSYHYVPTLLILCLVLTIIIISNLIPYSNCCIITSSIITTEDDDDDNDTNTDNAVPHEENHTNKPPTNIVILLADNLAYEDVGIFRRRSSLQSQQSQSQSQQRRRRRQEQQDYDQEEEDSTSTSTSNSSRTPHLDQAAMEGRRFLNWNSPAVLCSASRAALLTGKYPVRTGIYPRVFEPDATHGLLQNETTLADYLRNAGYATKIVGKWHLGQRPDYLPTKRGFDSWFGIPYHMSGGSIDDHVCGKDTNHTEWLPLFDGTTIVEQPVVLEKLAPRYVEESISFMKTNVEDNKPFFLYLPFSHVHQLCAPRHSECQWSSTHVSRRREQHHSYNATFADAVQEMDWIAGKVLASIQQLGSENNTIVLFTSDNGPWTAEQSCAGTKGRFRGQWLADNVDLNCTACPSDYVPAPLPGRPRRCIFPVSSSSSLDKDDTKNEVVYEVEGIHCGQDTGLGSAWEANVRMPAFVKWPGGNIPAGSETRDMVTTLDVVPTLLSLIRDAPTMAARSSSSSNNSTNTTASTRSSSSTKNSYHNLTPLSELDGIDVSDVFLGRSQQQQQQYDNNDDEAAPHTEKEKAEDRVVFFWRDGFSTGPLPQPYGRFDVVAMKIGVMKLWFWTKSSHYNPDREVYHDPPLVFNVWEDPAEEYVLNDPNNNNSAAISRLITKARLLLQQHKESIDWTYPLCLERDTKYLPCVNETSNCRTTTTTASTTTSTTTIS